NFAHALEACTTEAVNTISGAMIQPWKITLQPSQGGLRRLDAAAIGASFARKDHASHRRVVIQGITGIEEGRRLKAAWSPANLFCLNSANYFIKTTSRLDLALLAYFNSRLAQWQFAAFSTNSNVNLSEVVC